TSARCCSRWLLGTLAPHSQFATALRPTSSLAASSFCERRFSPRARRTRLPSPMTNPLSDSPLPPLQGRIGAQTAHARAGSCAGVSKEHRRRFQTPVTPHAARRGGTPVAAAFQRTLTRL